MFIFMYIFSRADERRVGADLREGRNRKGWKQLVDKAKNLLGSTFLGQ